MVHLRLFDLMRTPTRVYSFEEAMEAKFSWMLELPTEPMITGTFKF